jgi:putative flippase GtrA
VTFNDTSAEHAASKVVRYLSLQIANVGTNTFLLFIFVEYLKIWYILAELVIALGLAVVTFIISRRFIFNRQVNNTQ